MKCEFLKKLEIYVVVGVAAILVCGITYSLSGPFNAEDFNISTVPSQSAAKSSVPVAPPASLEPSLRTLDGVVHHG